MSYRRIFIIKDISKKTSLFEDFKSDYKEFFGVDITVESWGSDVVGIESILDEDSDKTFFKFLQFVYNKTEYLKYHGLEIIDYSPFNDDDSGEFLWEDKRIPEDTNFGTTDKIVFNNEIKTADEIELYKDVFNGYKIENFVSYTEDGDNLVVIVGDNQKYTFENTINQDRYSKLRPDQRLYWPRESIAVVNPFSRFRESLSGQDIFILSSEKLENDILIEIDPLIVDFVYYKNM